MATLYDSTASGDFVTTAANLGANWDADNSGFTDWDVDTATAEAQGAQTGGNWIRTTTSAHAATADVKVSLTHSGSAPDCGVIARCTSVLSGSTQNTGYALFASTSLTLIRVNANGSEDTIGSGVSITAGAGKVIALEVSGTGATVSLKTYYDGVLKETLSDTANTAPNAIRLTSAGRTGMLNWKALGTNSRMSRFVVEDLVVGGGGPVIPVFMNQYRQRAA